ncbi:MAG: DUF2809 domain-containing protein [bacterium]|nr:MAG: DUF2809 domain-containing protein [bacterium]
MKRTFDYKAKKTPQHKLLLLISLVLVSLLGIFTKVYAGPGQIWINHSAGGIAYEIFFCLFLHLAFPKIHPIKIVLSVFIATCLIEFLQLYHPHWLQVLRSFWLGKAILGTTFNPWDFFHYLVGCIIGILWIFGIKYLSGRYEAH